MVFSSSQISALYISAFYLSEKCGKYAGIAIPIELLLWSWTKKQWNNKCLCIRIFFNWFDSDSYLSSMRWTRIHFDCLNNEIKSSLYWKLVLKLIVYLWLKSKRDWVCIVMISFNSMTCCLFYVEYQRLCLTICVCRIPCDAVRYIGRGEKTDWKEALRQQPLLTL